MEIRHKEIEGKGMFYIEERGVTLGRMFYSRQSENHITIEHTNVDDALKLYRTKANQFKQFFM